MEEKGDMSIGAQELHDRLSLQETCTRVQLVPIGWKHKGRVSLLRPARGYDGSTKLGITARGDMWTINRYSDSRCRRRF